MCTFIKAARLDRFVPTDSFISRHYSGYLGTTVRDLPCLPDLRNNSDYEEERTGRGNGEEGEEEKREREGPAQDLPHSRARRGGAE